MADNHQIHIPTSLGFNHVQCWQPNVGERRKHRELDSSALLVNGGRPLGRVTAPDREPRLMESRQSDRLRRVHHGLIQRSEQGFTRAAFASDIASAEAVDTVARISEVVISCGGDCGGGSYIGSDIQSAVCLTRRRSSGWVHHWMIFGSFRRMPARTRVSNSNRCNSGAIRITGNLCPLWELDVGKSGSAPGTE